ncbi:MAG: multicopper oxidase family protein [Planctomycetota bacterium]
MTFPNPASPFDRRAFLGVGSLAGAAWGLRSITSLPVWPIAMQQPLRPQVRPHAHIRLRGRRDQIALRPGPTTSVARYEGTLVSGTASHLQTIPGSYFGPILRFHQGQRARIDFQNELMEDSIIHWHGLEVPADMDGHPEQAVPSGSSYTYDFTVLNRAGTYWYHPHPDMRTGYQVSAGLAGLFIVSDDEEAALSLPRGEFDVPLAIQDRRIDRGNQLLYNHDTVAGFLGNEMFVNGFPDYVLDVKTRIYRLRVVNASNSRVYKLAFSDGTPMVVIGNDGGLLAAPVTKPYVMLSPGERVELWADFSGKLVGAEFFLQSLPFTVAGPSGGQTPVNGAPLDLCKVHVVAADTETLTLPVTLSAIMPYDVNQAVNFGSPRSLPITIGMGMWLVNNAPFGMNDVAPNEYIQRGDLELWEFTNTFGMTQMLHPMHLHGPQFQVHSRQITPAGAANYETIRYGFVDEGWKDTIIVAPGETVQFLVRHANFAGKFLYHCHNLEHEDMGMMRNYVVMP